MMYVNNQHNGRIHAMTQVIKNLRTDDLDNGQCFMIFGDELPEDQPTMNIPMALSK